MGRGALCFLGCQACCQLCQHELSGGGCICRAVLEKLLAAGCFTQQVTQKLDPHIRRVAPADLQSVEIADMDCNVCTYKGVYWFGSLSLTACTGFNTMLHDDGADLLCCVSLPHSAQRCKATNCSVCGYMPVPSA